MPLDLANKSPIGPKGRQSSIQNQFEFMQQSWCNDPKFLRVPR